MPDQQLSTPALDVHQQMTAMATGHWVSQMIRAAVDFSLADHLADGGLTADEVAERENSAPRTTFRLMRACVAIGLLRADADGRFYGTPLLATLRSDAPDSLRGLALTATVPAQWLSWNEFTASVRKGETQVHAALGTDFFDYLDQHPAQARDFAAGLVSTTMVWAAEAAKALDTSGVEHVVDVGGGDGLLLLQLLEANPDLRGTVFDRPGFIDKAKEATARKGMGDRAEVVAGDFFRSVPDGDLLLLKLIMHDWDDDECVTILERCREALAPGGRIAVIETILGAPDAPGTGAVQDMVMLAITTGQERSLDEYDALLAAAGLRRAALHAAGAMQSVIEAVPA